MVKDNLSKSIAKDDFRFIYYNGELFQSVIVKNKGVVEIELKYPTSIESDLFNYSFDIYGKSNVNASDETLIQTIHFHFLAQKKQTISVPNSYKYVKINMRNNSGYSAYVAFGVTLHS